MRKKFLAALLAASLVFTIAPVIPAGTAVTAAAETAETAVTELNCVEFLDAQTDGYEVTESGIEITFKSTSASSAKDNWETPALIAYTADEPKFKGANYKEYAIIRSDAFAWKDGVFEDNKDSDNWKNFGYTFDAKLPEDWAAWLETNKAGADCKVKAVKKDGKIQIEFTNGNLTSVTTFPAEDGKKTYISLSGQNCKLTNIKTGGEAPDRTAGAELDCVGFWTAHTDGREITESGTALTFKNTSNPSASNNYETPVVAVYTNSEPKVNNDSPDYKEYVVIRSDNYAWEPAGVGNSTEATWTSSGYDIKANLGTSFDWAAWVEANKAGTDCKVQAIKKDGKVYVEVTNGNLTSVTSFPITGNEKIYLSLTGENCKLTDIKTANYTGINDIISEPSAPSEPSTPSDPGNNGDDEPELSTMKIKSVVAKANKKQVTGKLSVSDAKVKVKVGSAKYKAAKVNGKKFTFKTSKLKKGTKIKIKAAKSGYETVTKSVKVK